MLGVAKRAAFRRGRIRVNAQLSDGATGASVWSSRFETTRRDLFEIQDEIVGQIAQALELQLIDAEACRDLPGAPRQSRCTGHGHARSVKQRRFNWKTRACDPLTV